MKSEQNKNNLKQKEMTATTSCNYYNENAFGVYGSSTCISETSTSTGPGFISGFAYGDIIISFFLFILTAVIIYSFIYSWSAGIRTRKIS